MKILCLYNNDCALELFDWLKTQGHDTVLRNEALNVDYLNAQNFDLAVSYTYRFILTGEMLRALHGNAVNIHNAFLPWNRGADPNIWSCIEGTPRGVTLHYMDASLDKGEIIAQQLVNDGDNETLKSSYNNLDAAAKQLFKDAFRYYEFWPLMKKIPTAKGNYHSVKDGESFRTFINTYDMPVSLLKQLYEEAMEHQKAL